MTSVSWEEIVENQRHDIREACKAIAELLDIMTQCAPVTHFEIKRRHRDLLNKLREQYAA